MQKRAFGIARIITASAVLITACSSTTRTIEIEEDPNDGTAGTPRGTGSPAPSQGPQPGGGVGKAGPTGPTGGSCGTTANVLECSMCCEQSLPQATGFYYAALTSCFCRTPGPCKTQCASTICGAQPIKPDPTCITCLEQNEACYDAADQACSGNRECQLLLKCDADSQCAQKPIPEQ
jgi:hypothetical protein